MATCPNSRSDIKELQFDYSELPNRFTTKPAAKKPSRCFGCHKRFKDKLPPRDCGLCGAVFCQQCTIYRRRICRISGTPYDLGVLTNVCETCFKIKVDLGCHRDHLSEFKKHRREKLEADVVKPVCSRMYTGTRLVQKELDRLIEGFATANNGFLTGIKISEWQKSATWVEPGNANKCYHCKKKFRIFDSKHNCRIGGQVCCAKCTKKEGLIIYQDYREGEPKWGINGKDNGPKTKYRLETYTICSSCSDNLEAMPVEYIDMSSQKKRVFMDSVYEVHQNISRMQTNVDKWLPEYQQEVEAVNLGMRSIKETEGKLARLHLNLSNTLPAIESNGKHLFELHQQRKSNDQIQKLLQNVLKGNESSYEEHVEQFRRTNTQLPNQFSKEKLCEVQEKLSQESMLSVYANIRKLAADLEDYTECYKLDGVFLEDAKKIGLAITEELSPWPQRLSSNWEELLRENTSRIDVSQMVKTSAIHDHVKIVIASQSLTIVQQCSSKLGDETLDLEFQKTKRCLKQAWDRLETTLIQYNRGACIALQ